ncbi:unnamed protein product [Heterobilharzia americana]|nr:unnamed protein product [Heterobilharzia americana]
MLFIRIIIFLLIPSNIRLLENFKQPWRRNTNTSDTSSNNNGSRIGISKEAIQNISMKLYKLENFITPNSIHIRLNSNECGNDEHTICGREVPCKLNQLQEKDFKLSGRIDLPTYATVSRSVCNCEDDYGVEVYHSEKREIFMKCYTPNPCEQCDEKHTIQCIVNSDNSVTCLCETGYSEFEKCKEIKDGCKIPHSVAKLSGNEACLVEQSNVCQPAFDSYQYTCLCKDPYSEDKRLSFPNCMNNVTYCLSSLCAGFQPPVSKLLPGPAIFINIEDYNMLESDDCHDTICYCPDGWVGKHCTEPRGSIVPFSWSPWSTCNPDCIMLSKRWNYKTEEEIYAGESRTTEVGYKSKFARCNHNDSRYCEGMYRIWERCTVKNLCNIERQPRISTVIGEAMSKNRTKHNEVHHKNVSPVPTGAVEITWEEQHQLNLLGVIVCIVLFVIAITVLEIHHMVVHWSKLE